MDMEYHGDIAEQLESKDEFRHWGLATKICNLIHERKNSDCLVVGLNGKWGCGKSTVLNYIQAQLNPEEVIVVNFNPWRITDQSSLILTFLMRVAEALEKQLFTKSEKVAGHAKKLGGLLGTVGLSGAGEVLDAYLTGPDLEELKNRINHSLKDQSKKLVIVFDDIDRLDNNEIHILLKLIKLTADFERTIYLMAYDKQVVSSSLQQRYSELSPTLGLSFLEKIIQLEIKIPPISFDEISKFCYKEIDKVLKEIEISIAESHASNFTRSFSLGFGRTLKTPRQVKLYANRLRFAMPCLQGEVNYIDQMLIEAMYIFSPHTYELVSNNIDWFTGFFNERLRPDPMKEEVKSSIERSMELDQITNKSGFIEMLSHLFPKLQSLFGGSRFTSDFEEIWEKNKNVCSTKYFYRYFSYLLGGADVSDVVFERALSGDWSSLITLFENSSTAELINRLRTRSKTFDKKQSAELAEILARNPLLFNFQEMFFNSRSDFSQAAMLIVDLAFNLDGHERIDLLSNLSKVTPSTDFAVELSRWTPNPHWENATDTIDENELKSIESALINRMKNDMKQNDFSIVHSWGKNTIRCYWMLLEHEGHEFISSRLIEYFKTEESDILPFIKKFTPFSTDVSGLALPRNLERKGYENIGKLVDQETFTKIIKDKLEIEVSIEQSIYQLEGEESDVRLAKQYLWYFLNESAGTHSEGV